jgi:hypothetical protein
MLDVVDNFFWSQAEEVFYVCTVCTDKIVARRILPAVAIRTISNLLNLDIAYTYLVYLGLLNEDMVPNLFYRVAY